MTQEVTRQRILCRYWNNGDHQVAVVVVVNRFGDGDQGDWGAYIGASIGEHNSYRETKEKVAASGAKLAWVEVEALVPEHIRESIGLPYRD